MLAAKDHGVGDHVDLFAIDGHIPGVAFLADGHFPRVLAGELSLAEKQNARLAFRVGPVEPDLSTSAGRAGHFEGA